MERKQRAPVLVVHKAFKGKTAVLWGGEVGGGVYGKEAKGASFGGTQGLERQQLSFAGGGGVGGGVYGKEAKDAGFGGTQGLEGQNSCPLGRGRLGGDLRKGSKGRQFQPNI